MVRWATGAALMLLYLLIAGSTIAAGEISMRCKPAFNRGINGHISSAIYVYRPLPPALRCRGSSRLVLGLTHETKKTLLCRSLRTTLSFTMLYVILPVVTFALIEPKLVPDCVQISDYALVMLIGQLLGPIFLILVSFSAIMTRVQAVSGVKLWEYLVFEV